MKSSFTLEKSNEQGNPRAGILTLPNGEVPTPVFMPVGTQATVKGTLPCDLHDVVKCPIILGNTYHLNLRPGVDIVRKAGGLSKFMNWNGPVLTDSGGFQVFSLSKLRKIDDAGVSFRSHIDGSEIFLGPREAIDIQDGLHSDIAMCLDECPLRKPPGRKCNPPPIVHPCGHRNALIIGGKKSVIWMEGCSLGSYRVEDLRIYELNLPRN